MEQPYRVHGSVDLAHLPQTSRIGILFELVIAPLCGLILPFMCTLDTKRWWLPVFILSAGFITLFVIGNLIAGFSRERQRPSTAAYLQSESSGPATWFTTGPVSDEWTDDFVGDNPRRTGVGEMMPIESAYDWIPVLAADAPYAGLSPTELVVRSDSGSGNTRTVELWIPSHRRSPVATLDVEPYDTARAATIAGRRLEPPESRRDLWKLTYCAILVVGLTLILELDPALPARLQVSGSTWDLDSAALSITGGRVRPEGTMPTPNFDYGRIL